MIIAKYNYQKLDRKTTSNARHYTTPDGNSVPSVTTVLEKTKPKAAREALERWKKRTPNAKSITKKAGSIGTIMHRKLEEHINDKLLPPGGNLGQQYGHKMAMTIINEGLKQVDEIWGVEVSLYNSQLYAGTTDAVGLWNGAPAIIDFKQSNRVKLREWVGDYFLQTVAYGEAHNEMFKTNINTGVILMCTNPECDEPLKYQEFVLEGKEYDKYANLWYDRLTEYYRKHG